MWSDPLSLNRFGGEFRMPSREKKGVLDERAEEVFAGIQAASNRGVAEWRLYFSAAQPSARCKSGTYLVLEEALREGGIEGGAVESGEGILAKDGGMGGDGGKADDEKWHLKKGGEET